jgi:nitrate/nitrite-specific signal transduction histidine kinase
MNDPSETTLKLIALLDKHRDELADSWLEAIRQEMPDTKYGQRPAERIRANNLDVLAMLIDLLSGTPLGTALERRIDIKAVSKAVDIGIDVSEVVPASLLLEDAALPLVRSAFPAGSAAGRQARLELRRNVHLLARVFVQVAAELTSQHLQEEQRRTALMLEMSRTIGRSLDLDKVLRQVTDGIAAAVGEQHCVLYIRGDDDQPGRVWAAMEKLPPTWVERLQPAMSPVVPPDLSLTRLVLEEKQPHACYDAQTDPRTDHETMRAYGIRSMLAVPCLLRDQVVAVALVATFDEHRAFTEEQVELALGVANTVAPAIENARLHQRVERLAVLEERARLAREIHDDVTQTLGALQLRMSLLDDLLSQDEVAQVRATLPELQDMVSDAYSGLRASIFDLRAMAFPAAAFLPALQDYLTDYRLHYKLDVALEADDDVAAMLDGNTGVQVIRIIQEALTNARRHARANRAWVRIHRQDDDLCVSVEDDGRGFDPSDPPLDGQLHFGLQVMGERAKKVGGRLIVDSRPGGGTRVVLRLPDSESGART